MHRSVLALLLAVVSNGAVADWVRVGNNETENLIIFANPDTIHRTGNKVSMWNLLDFSAIQRSAGSTDFPGINYLSVEAWHEYDCEKDQQRILSYYWYSENMGKGKLVFSDETAEDWYPIYPNSTKEILLKYACGTR